MIHLLGARLGHFSAQLRVSAGRQPTAKIIKTNTHLPSWMRKFLLEGAFSAVNPSGARIAVAAELAYRYPKARLVYVGGNASLRSANLSEAAVADDIFKNLGIREDRLQLERSVAMAPHERHDISRFRVEAANASTRIFLTGRHHR